MDKSSLPNKHQSYLLRVWQDQSEADGGQADWRFSLEEVQTHQRRGFASLEELFAFIKAQLAERPNDNTKPSA
jgi:hypothetical protein